MGLLDKLSKAASDINERKDKATRALDIAQIDLTKQTAILTDLERKLEILKNGKTVGKQAAIAELEKRLTPLREKVRQAESVYNGAVASAESAAEILEQATSGLKTGILDEIDIPNISIKLPSFPPTLPPIPSLGSLLPTISLPLKDLLVVPSLGTVMDSIPELPELETSVSGVIEGAAAEAAAAVEKAALDKAAKAAGGIDKVSKAAKAAAKKAGEAAGAAKAAANLKAAQELPPFGNISGPQGSFTRGKHIMEEIIATKTVSAPDIAATNSVSAPAATFGAINVVNIVGPMGTVNMTPSVTSPLGIFTSLAAPYKLFDIPHPSYEGMRLRHACLEGPEVAVYARGKAYGGSVAMPEYWKDLVDPLSITVQLTATHMDQQLYVAKTSALGIIVEGHMNEPYYYMVMAERKDVPKLVVETYEPLVTEEVDG